MSERKTQKAWILFIYRLQSVVLLLGIIGTIAIIVFMGIKLVNPDGAGPSVHTLVRFKIIEDGTFQTVYSKAEKIEIDKCSGYITTNHPLPRRIILLYYLFELGSALLATFMTYQIWKILQTLVEGNPFIKTNGLRLRYTAFSLMGLGLIWNISIPVMTQYFKDKVLIEGIQIGSWGEMKGELIGVGLLVLIISEVFRIGATMKEEQDLII